MTALDFNPLECPHCGWVYRQGLARKPRDRSLYKLALGWSLGPTYVQLGRCVLPFTPYHACWWCSHRMWGWE